MTRSTPAISASTTPGAARRLRRERSDSGARHAARRPHHQGLQLPRLALAEPGARPCTQRRPPWSGGISAPMSGWSAMRRPSSRGCSPPGSRKRRPIARAGSNASPACVPRSRVGPGGRHRTASSSAMSSRRSPMRLPTTPSSCPMPAYRRRCSTAISRSARRSACSPRSPASWGSACRARSPPRCGCRGGRSSASLADGGFMMTGVDARPRRRAQAADRHLLSNNRSLGTIRFNQERDFPGRPSATDLSGADFAALARSFGCEALTIAREDEVVPIVVEALRRKGPVLVEVTSSLSAILPTGART